MQMEPPLSACGEQLCSDRFRTVQLLPSLKEHKSKCPVWISFLAVPSRVVGDLQDAFECVVVEGAAAVRATKQQQCAAHAAICPLRLLRVLWSGAA